MERFLCQLAVFGVGATVTSLSVDSHAQVLGVGVMVSSLLIITVEQMIKKAKGA